MSGAVPPPAAHSLGWVARVPRAVFSGAVGLGVGTQHRPHSVRSCELLLRAVGVARGRPRGGGALRSCEGRLGSGAPPPPAARPQGGLLGSATPVLWARVCGRGCAARPPGGRPGLGACRVCGACAVFGVLVGAWRCGVCRGAVVRRAASLRSSPRCSTLLSYSVVLYLAWLVAVPPSPHSAAGFPSSSFCVAAFFTLSSTIRWSALFPGLYFSLPHLRPCVCFSIFTWPAFSSFGSSCSTASSSCGTKERWVCGLFRGLRSRTMTCALCWRCWVSALLRRRCLLTWLVRVWLTPFFFPYHLYGIGDL